ncbi:hypothetical protein A1359_03625 [Methylomonas lenta]|uniref:PEP-CTERM sorting domain-containing protein n=1 Tax=Methylomonas lenta TaxID=980561 RepID=A0A177NQE2_9GAMM|nr:hypothetical protein [Methylomonas lenta]OAI20111.1 hypothetical protein A1359_03625 [Methylomonas lenta]
MMDILRTFLIGLLFLASNQAMAVPTSTTSSFYVDWSGVAHFNEAEAHGWLTVYNDEGSKFSNSADDAWLFPFEDVVDFSVTITGASSGNGTFGLTDFDFFIWSTKTTAEWPLDLAHELVNQATTGGPWSSNHSIDASGGEFNLFANLLLNPAAPNSNGAAFQIATNGGNGDILNLTSFRPVPIPAAFWLFGSALLGLSRIGFKRQAQLT